MHRFLPYYLPLFLIVYLVLIFVVPSVGVYRRTGINPATLQRRGNAHDYNGTIMKFLTGLLLVAVLLFSLPSTVYKYLNPIVYLGLTWLQYTELVTVHASLMWIVFAQYHRKQSRRTEIEEKNQTNLASTGLINVSRDSIFFGKIASITGGLLIIRERLTSFVDAAFHVVIQMQLRLEEEYFSRQHSHVYEEYRTKVRRLL